MVTLTPGPHPLTDSGARIDNRLRPLLLLIPDASESISTRTGITLSLTPPLSLRTYAPILTLETNLSKRSKLLYSALTSSTRARREETGRR